jgi:putative peptidoglycan lipid II flippase
VVDVLQKWKLWMHTTTNRKILAATMVIAAFSLIARAASTVKEMAVAGAFGASDTLDSYLMALLVPTYAITVIGGSFNAALIPTYVRVKERDGAASAQRLFSNIMAGSLALLSLTSVLLLTAAPLYLPIIASGFGTEKIALTSRLLCILSPLIILSGVNTTWGAVLNAERRFGLVAVAPAITPLVVILFLLAGGARWGISSLAFGTTAGILLELYLLGTALTRKGISPWPRWSGLDANVRQVFKQFVPMISGALLMSATGFID